MQTYRQSRRLRDVRYDVRGPILTEAMRLEAEGHDVLRLNLGNMRPFGLDARPELVDAVARGLEDGQAYSDSRGIPAAREATAQSVADYASSDLLCYFAEDPETLVARQRQEWEPVLQRAERDLGLSFVRAAGILHRQQPQTTLSRVRDLAAGLDDFRLAGVAFGASLFGSSVLALALHHGWLDGGRALALSRLDEIFQEEAWGIDEEAAERVARLSIEAVMLETWFRALDAA
jgi:chaperone required for assembly of F1-ATPase